MADNDNKPDYTGVADYLYLKAMEECGEAVQAISKMFRKGVGAKHDDEKTTLVHVSEELSNVSTIIAMLIDLELLDNKKFWAEHDKKAEKWGTKVAEMINKVGKTDNDSDGREASSK